ncbi:MAG: polyisoprenyl-teichoic acid--peptidoglycan teichoic acid transferase [Clostridiales bacterium]|jgi:LCP family protein required for cell wall assembly|nr:polyisoprenyl-teichoic acid--peptidoglycan teichoic acid transferase [Clostridiales bacterium]
MKFYIKVFVISLVGFLSLFGGILFAFETLYTAEPTGSDATSSAVETTVGTTESATEPEEIDDRTELQKIAEASDRINVLAFGLNDSLADTIMLVSFDPSVPRLDIISVPRDTYNPIEGYDGSGQKKINAIYGMKDIGGVNGMKKYLSEFLGVPIDYYVRVDFNAVQAVVDTLGGYDVYVPFNMDYDDVWDTPPLHIHFEKGQYHLDGADTVKYLRWRKNSDGSMQEGDVARIERHQAFVDEMIQKALSFKLPSVINTIIGSNYVKTDMTLENALAYAVSAASMTSDNVNFYTIDGEAKMINGLSYWVHDPAALETLLFDIYGYSDVYEETEAETETP